MAVRKKAKETRLERILKHIVLGIGIFTIALALVALFSLIPVLVKEWPVQREVAKWDGYDKKTEDICRTELLGENRAVVIVIKDCRVFKGCNSEYIMELNKLNSTWTVNESSKRVLWEKTG